MVQQNQQLTLQVSTSTLLIGMVAALLAIPATIFMTIWLLQPDAVSAGNFEQSANTGVTYQVPAGYTLVPASMPQASDNTCSGEAASKDSEAGHEAPVSAVPVYYGAPANVTTGSVTQTQSETNTNVDNSVTNRYVYRDSFNTNTETTNISDSFNHTHTDTDIDIDTDVDIMSNNNVDNDNSVIDSEEVINSETDTEMNAIIVGLTPNLVR